MAHRILSRSLDRRAERATASSDDADEDLSIALLSLERPSYAKKNVRVVAIHHAFGHYPFADPFLHELLSCRERENNTKADVTQEKGYVIGDMAG
jgi:hypothetical protein